MVAFEIMQNHMYHHKVTALCNVQLDNRLISLDILSTILLTIYLNHKDKKEEKG